MSRPPLAKAAIASGMAVLCLLSPALASAASKPSAVSTPVADPYYPAKGSTVVDALHYDLALRWAANQQRLRATATIRLRVASASSVLPFDFSTHLSARAVTVDGSAVPFSHPGNKLILNTGSLPVNSRHTVVVTYGGKPQPAAAPTKRFDIPSVGWTNARDGGMWTMQEPFGAFTWYPVNDHPSDKAAYDITVNTPGSMVGVSNGALISRRDGKRTVTHWRLTSPASSYLVTLAIGDYRRYRDQGPGGLPLTYWVRPQDTKLLRALRASPAILRWLESKLGPYPFSRAGVIVVPSNSAMETQTLVTLGSRVRGDLRELKSVIAHEYAHQWYGDTVTPNNWKDLWLNESFAMFIEIAYRVSNGWEAESSWRQYALQYDRTYRGRQGGPGDYDKSNFGSGCVYLCGATMLFELRDRIGSQQLWSALKAWPQQHRNTNVDRTDYVTWINGRLQRDFTRFFAQWLNSPTTPPT